MSSIVGEALPHPALTGAPLGGGGETAPSTFLPIVKNEIRYRNQALHTPPSFNFTHPDHRNFSRF